MTNTYIYPLSHQLTLPLDYKDSEFAKLLKTLQEECFYGVELNILNFKEVNPQELVEYFATFNLKIVMFATGAYAKANGLSISSTDEALRTKSVEALKEMIDFSAQIGCGAICGFIKGGIVYDVESANKQCKKSLIELIPYLNKKKVYLQLEATNHKETSIINTCMQGVTMLDGVDCEYIKILPDTYHIALGERSMYESLIKYKDKIISLHLSEENRFIPGFGNIDFEEIFCVLEAIGYNGLIAVEGNTKISPIEDAKISAKHLRDCIASINKRLR